MEIGLFLNVFHNYMQIKYFSIAFAETNNVLPPDNQGNLTPRKIFDILSRKLNMEIQETT